jgi:hypothetical protein
MIGIAVPLRRGACAGQGGDIVTGNCDHRVPLVTPNTEPVAATPASALRLAVLLQPTATMLRLAVRRARNLPPRITIPTPTAMMSALMTMYE